MRFISTSSSDGVTGAQPLVLLGHGGGQHKAAPDVVARARRYAAEGSSVVAIDAPHHGDRPRDEEFDRVLAGLRAGMAAGGDPGALVAGMHGHLAARAVADWRAVLTAVRDLDGIGTGPVGYCGLSMGCRLGTSGRSGSCRSSC